MHDTAAVAMMGARIKWLEGIIEEHLSPRCVEWNDALVTEYLCPLCGGQGFGSSEDVKHDPDCYWAEEQE